ncbi:hypothetical protein LTR62_000958 [Meristemomyces frigidus]|uniref:Mitotic checkpoint protein BUB3 n=1 Tax=Meristemomyces frigidus TaxID=1508187 RepID=A0AAN7TK42_9PEZI|nr:hypothetical protein LTR62_000958 [Meristemomyces frigidus]
MSTPHEVDNPPQEPISALCFSPDSSRLAVASWNRDVSIYDNTASPDIFSFSGRRIQYRAPVLDVCWGGDSETLYTVGTDWDVRRVDISQAADDGAEGQGTQLILSTHEAPSNKIAYSPSYGLIISTSWDATMHVHDVSNGKFFRVKLAAKPFALNLSPDKAVIAMAERKVSVYDLSALRTLVEQVGVDDNGMGSNPAENVFEGGSPWQQRESSLKFMTRAVACMPDGSGFATSSIEGRVAVEWFDPEAQSKTYAFKCHRQTVSAPADENGEETELDVVYPVNTLAFHPVHGTFATGGGDGVVSVWDANTKRRVRQYQNMGASVASIAFSPDGEFMAVGISPGYEDGQESEQEAVGGSIKIVVRRLAGNEVKGRPGK